MLETIILAPNANATELLRTMTKHGRNTFGVRALNAAELAESVLMKRGITHGKRFIGSGEGAALLYGIIGEIKRFKAVSFSTARELYSTLNTVRMMIPENERSVMREKLADTEFSENGAAVLEAYEKYTDKLDREGLIDSVGLIRLAAENDKAINAALYAFEDFPLSPLEKHLLERISGGKYTVTSLLGFIGAEKSAPAVADITEAYGASNEVRDIIARIFGNDIPADKCVVACTDTAVYSRLFYEVAREFELPVTFGCGLPVTESSPGRLLKSYHNWNTSGFNGKTALEAMIFSDAFDTDKLCETLGTDLHGLHNAVRFAGRMKLSDNAEENRRKLAAFDNYGDNGEELNLAKALAQELEKGCSYLIRNYSYIRKDSAHTRTLDRAAVKKICTELDSFSAVMKGSVSEIIPAVLAMNTAAENRRPGCLHITGIESAINTVGENLFIAGMSAAQFPGIPAENYLLTDSDMLRFGGDAPTSESVIAQKRDTLRRLTGTASSLGSRIHISYIGFDTAELKEVNASSALFEIYKAQNGENADMDSFEKSLRHVEYFSSVFCPSDNAAKAYADEKKPGRFRREMKSADSGENIDISGRKFSVTDIEKYLKCQKMFWFNAVLGIPEPEEYDPFLLVEHSEKGIVFHDLMKMNADCRMTEDEIREKAGIMWDKMIGGLAPFNADEAAKGRTEFIEMAEYGHFSDKDNTVKMAEEKLEYTHPSGITVSGKLDRLETTPTGANIIADFKTGKSRDYSNDDFDSCVQVILYAYMLKQKGIDVSRGEYRFVKEWLNVSCGINGEMLEKADKLLGEIAESIKTNTYKYAEKCDYCRYKGICDK